MATPFPDERLDELETAIFAGRKIETIKLYRELTGLGLKDSKEAVEQIEAALRAKAPEKFTAPAAKGCMTSSVRVLLLGALAGAAAYGVAQLI